MLGEFSEVHVARSQIAGRTGYRDLRLLKVFISKAYSAQHGAGWSTVVSVNHDGRMGAFGCISHNALEIKVSRKLFLVAEKRRTQ